MFRHGPIPWVDGARPRRMAELMMLLWLLSVADLAFTLWAHFFTPFHELNPLFRPLLQGGWISAVVLLKLGLTGLGTGIFWRLREHRQAELAAWMAVALYVMLAVRWSSYTMATGGPLLAGA